MNLPAPLVHHEVSNAAVSLKQQTQADASCGVGGDRLSARRELREKIAELATRDIRREALQQAIADINAECDGAVLRHAERTGPLQEQLRSNERRLVEQMLAGTTDDELESERKALADQIRTIGRN